MSATAPPFTMPTSDLFKAVFDLMADPATSPFAESVTITQNATDTTVFASILTGDGLTEDPKIQLSATVRVADLPQRPREQDSLTYLGDTYQICNAKSDQHGHATLLCRLVRGVGPRA